ncbi:LAGLIDADG family homing endonuclease [Clostridium haemolyticum]|nr:LAGLIDADG family homing endonuclease [Clostridium haemolyticum]
MQYIIQCFYDNIGSRDVAKTMNCSKPLILNIWKQHNLYKQRIPQNKIDYILRNTHRPFVDVAKDANLANETVKKILMENNIKLIYKKTWLKERNKNIIKEYQHSIPITQISNKYNITDSMVRNILRRTVGDNYTCNHNLSQEEINYIIEHYYDKSSQEISQILNIHRGTITKLWHDNGLFGKDQSRRYYCDFNYFNRIDTRNKAYVLGFICADGCVYKRDSHQGLLQITIHKKDIKLLKDINNELKSNYPINTYNDYISLSITSDKIFNCLKRIGIEENKTWKLNLDKLKIPNKYILDFTRGYFDGDGCITYTSKRGFIPSSFNVQIVGNKQFILSLQERIRLLYDITSKAYKQTSKKYTQEFYALDFINTQQKYAFLKSIYNDVNSSILSLDRKQEKANKLITLIESNKTNRNYNIKAVEYFLFNIKEKLQI